MNRTLFCLGLVVFVFPQQSFAAAPDEKAPGAREIDWKLENILSTRFTFDVGSESFSEVLLRLEKEFKKAFPKAASKLAIQILAKDLQAKGITKNQRVSDLKFEQKSVAKILTRVCRKANPDRNADSPASVYQQLVWTIGPDPADETKRVILITTRAAAEAKKLPLPAVFLPEKDRGMALRIAAAPLNAKGIGGAAKHVFKWSEIVSAETLEDSVKRQSTELQKSITTPEKFAGAGYRVARRQFTELAVLFAVISQYDKAIRWQMKATPLSRQFARSSFNTKVGTIQSFNEAKQRRQDLSDLVRGGDVVFPKGFDEPITDWGKVFDRAPIMQRMEQVAINSLKVKLADKKEFAASKGEIIRDAELVALISVVLRQKGSEDAGDADYDEYTKELTAAAKDLHTAVRLDNFDKAKASLIKIHESCSRCHSDFR